MGLKTDIADAFKKSAGMLPGETSEPVELLAADIEKAIEKFILKQEFRVVKLKTKMDVEKIKTTADVDCNVAPETLMGPYGPLLGFIKKMIKTLTDIPGAGFIASPLEEAYDKLDGAMQAAANKVSKGGSTLPAPDFKKGQKIPGKGGSLVVDGTSNVKVPNYKTSNNPSGLASDSAVILYKGEVKGKG